MKRSELKAFIVKQGYFSEERVNKMRPVDLVREYLEAQGVKNLSCTVVEAVFAAYGLNGINVFKNNLED